MNFAINYSPQAAGLVREGVVAVDWFKCPDLPGVAAEAAAVRPAYVHFPLRAGRGLIDDATLDHVEAVLAETDTPYVNIHLTPWAGDFDDMPVDTRDGAHARLLTERMLDDVLRLVERFGAERVIAENGMWDPSPEWQIPAAALDAQVISRIVREAACGFVLDVAHAAASARYLGQDERAYLLALPVGRLAELHVSGLRHREGRWEDHFALSEADFALTQWAVDHVRSGDWPVSWTMTFEYGGVRPSLVGRSDADVIARQVPRLCELARSVGPPRPPGTV